MERGRRVMGRTVRALSGLLAAAGLLAVGSVMLSGGPERGSVSRGSWADWDGTAVFLGDSITDFCDLKTYYPGLPAANQGVSGDTTENIMARLDRAVFALSPEVLVLHGGINDLLQGREDGYIVEQLRAIIEAVQARLPDTRIILQSLYPVAEGEDLYFTGHIRAVNEKLEGMAEELDVLYVDVFSVLQAPDGRLQSRYSDDGLHPNAAGYGAVQPVLTEALARVIGLGPAA